jgi:hypothetical protein
LEGWTTGKKGELGGGPPASRYPPPSVRSSPVSCCRPRSGPTAGFPGGGGGATIPILQKLVPQSEHAHCARMPGSTRGHQKSLQLYRIPELARPARRVGRNAPYRRSCGSAISNRRFGRNGRLGASRIDDSAGAARCHCYPGCGRRQLISTGRWNASCRRKRRHLTYKLEVAASPRQPG